MNISSWFAAAFGASTLILVVMFRASIVHPRSHGFYRFLAFEAIAALILLALPVWFVRPYAWNQLISWALLLASGALVVHAILLLRTIRKSTEERSDPALLGFEKTTALVIRGAYRWIRHPMYASLFYLAWGVFFKLPGWLGFALALAATGFLYATARVEEAENVRYFGEEYRAYMRRTRRFIPYVF